jgi:hypothetical protein
MKQREHSFQGGTVGLLMMFHWNPTAIILNNSTIWQQCDADFVNVAI